MGHTVGNILLEKGKDVNNLVQELDINRNGIISPLELRRFLDELGVVFPKDDF